METLEPRQMLAGDLVAQWRAESLKPTTNDGDVVAEWIDSVSNITAIDTGQAKLSASTFSGRASIRFDASDGIDRFLINSGDNPISNANDFSVTVAFATASNDLVGSNGDWFENTGLVDANRFGFGKDWGLTINTSGQLATGMSSGFGGTKTTVLSSESGLNDGQLHFATVTRSAGNLSIYVDGNVATTTSGASADARDPIELSIGALAQDKNGFTGDIAEVRIYNGALSDSEIADVHNELQSYYVNLAPTAADDSYQFNEDEGFFGFVQVKAEDGLLANDTDPEGDPLSVVLLTQPAVGTVTASADGSFIYAPPANHFGVETFTYQAFDGQLSNIATVTLNIANVYDPATAVADQYKTQPTEVLVIDADNGLLANDVNPDAVTLEAELVNDVNNGSLTLNQDGSFSYAPNGFAGVASFDYRLFDGTGRSNTATVTIVVNTPPVANDDAFELNEDTTLTAAPGAGVTANDVDAENDALQAILVSDVTHGDLSLNSDGSFSYAPVENYFGEDSFQYKLSDGEDESEVATVSLLIRPVNDAPAANSDVFVAVDGSAITVSAEEGILRNDTDIEEDSLTAVLASGPSHGTLALQADGSFSYQASDGFSGTDHFTYRANDGSANSSETTVTLYVGTSPVVISEFVVANATGQQTRVRSEPDGRFRGESMTPDWIEIHNTTDAAFDLGGFHLTDSANNKTKWAFPDNTIVGPGEYFVVYASRLSITDPRLDETGRLHTNFKLQPEGEYLALTSPHGAVLHEFGPRYPNQRPDVSYGLTEDNVAKYFATPTLGEANSGETYDGIANETSFSVDRGFFNEPFQVEITTTEENGQIWYTLDGSEPSPTSGTLYSGPITISGTSNLRAATFKDGLLPSLIDSQTYIFPDQVLQQTGEGLESAQWGDNGPDWEMDPEIVNHADPEIRVTTEDLTVIPTVSLTTDWDWFFGDKGIYPWDPGRGIGVARDGYEIPTSFEYFDVGGSNTQAYGTVQIVGGSSPNRDVNDWKSDKLSMRVKFTENVGKSRLNYPIFGPEATDSFTTLVVDARLNNVWTYSGGSEPQGQRDRALYFRDQLAADMENAAGGLAPHGFKVHVYINGVYWGLHTLHERPDDQFAASYLGGDNDDYDVLKHNTGDVISGTNENYNAMLDAVREDMTVAENYEAVKQLLDIEEFIEYMLVNQYGGNLDWAHQNWYASYNRVDPNGRWRYHSWDAEKIITNLRDNVTRKNDRGGPTEVHFRLSRNPEYRQLYQDIVYREFFHGGTFSPDRAAELFRIRADQIGTSIRAESARWGDNQRSTPYTRRDWLNNVNKYLEDYFPERTDVVLQQLERLDLWADEDHQPPTLIVDGSEVYGGYVAPGSSLSMSASDGTIYYTTDGTDPRLSGGDLADTAIVYGGPIAIHQAFQLKARLRKPDGSWSPLVDTSFTVNVSASPDNLRITEINYHPSDPNDAEKAAGFTNANDFEFIELQNISDKTIDLRNVSFRRGIDGSNIEGIEFNFADGAITELGPGEFIVVVEDLEAFRARYGDAVPVAGQWQGGLGNADEPIRLFAGDTAIHDFTYLDDWVPATDGKGPTLQIIDPNGSLEAWNSAEGWRASSAVGGTPGRADEGRIPGDSNGDGVFNSSDFVVVFQAAEYEDDIPGNSTFEEGDWNGDGDFDSADFVFVFTLGHYVNEAIIGDQIAGALVDAKMLDRHRPARHGRDFVVAPPQQALVAEAKPIELDVAAHDAVFEQIDNPARQQRDAAFNLDSVDEAFLA